MLSFPLEILLGRLALQDILIGYAVQLGWLALVVTGMLAAWRVGVKQFAAVGS
jgi:ABC-type uncharacterized transport system permease subunit